ncbi:acyl-CoA-binding domain-containing protein 4 [Sphaerodactylus townsendi]|uniref:acyl-CoA-binding domain-containing protein 4 n=1 Tax=Sphaerodactylus townsendi TaxID=933632 RepID=UPI002026B4E6|nr:acyl-CoA-binding domain-containing protein 4 [Sphaerodactylus townsendi]
MTVIPIVIPIAIAVIHTVMTVIPITIPIAITIGRKESRCCCCCCCPEWGGGASTLGSHEQLESSPSLAGLVLHSRPRFFLRCPVLTPVGMEVEEPDYQKQFEAAVRCIQGLPRKGSSYRPSYEEMLRFYSYYKQATMGQCQIPRPGFWDPIGRYKWDAWNRLGKMTKKEAMVAYIREMKKSAQKVIDTVPLDETSEDMFDYFKPLYEVIDDMPRPSESFFKKKLAADGEVSFYVAVMLKQLLCLSGKKLSSAREAEYWVQDTDSREMGRRPSTKETSAVNHLPESQVGDAGGHRPPVPKPASTWEEELSKSDPQTTPAERGFEAANVSAWQEVDERLRSTIQTLQKNMEEVVRRLSRLESLASLQKVSGSIPGPDQAVNHVEDVCLRPWMRLPFQVDSIDLDSGPFPAMAASCVRVATMAGPPKAASTLVQPGVEPSHPPAHLTPPTLLFLLAWPLIVQWLLGRFQSWKR